MDLFTDNVDFYPTPKEVISQMMIGEDICGKTILEPSAGKGDIVVWLKENGANKVIACEKEEYLRKLLFGKCEVVADDFLSLTSEQVSHVDYIVMNPPFSSGAKHILHAWDIAPAGCTIVALCNSSNLSSTWNQNYQRLQEVTNLYGNEEYLGNVFDKGAERRTNVSVSLVKLYKAGEGDSEFDGYFFSQVDEDIANLNEKEGIMQYNIVRDLVNRYVSAVKLFDNTIKAANLINSTAEYFDYVKDEEGKEHQKTYGYLPIKFGAITMTGKSTEVTHDIYKKELQKYYWHIIFRKLNMQKYATLQLREQINKFIEQQVNVPFTMGNIYRVIDMVVQTNGQRMYKALEEAFDHICSFSSENSTAGEKWKTNANYMVNKRFIVPYITRYETRWPQSTVELSYGCSTDRLEDICKALCFITGVDYDKIRNLRQTVYQRKPLWGEWFEWGFFYVRGYKKGTMHFEFQDENVWHKFNYEVSKIRGWDLPKKTNKRK